MIKNQPHEKNKRKAQNFLITALIITGLVFIGVLLFIAPIKQNPNYHLFADRRNLLSIPNFWNVISNLPYVITGLLGLNLIICKKHQITENQAITSFLVFFIGIVLIGIGSCYYHLNPTNHTLFWDRLPMSISFMAFFSIIISEFISLKTGSKILFPLIITGIASLIYWQITENNGCGDLRFYGIIQFLPMILVSIILLFYNNSYSNKNQFILILLLYALAKVFESLDYFVFNSSVLISGHTLKHFVSALAPLLMIKILHKRMRLSNDKHFPQIN